MTEKLVLASASEVRLQLLQNAGLTVQVQRALVDEVAIRGALLAEGATPRDIADTLAEYKARYVSQRQPDALVIGCDQILDFNGAVLAKPKSTADARDQLQTLCGQSHKLLSAAVVYEAGKPVWRHVGVVRLKMRDFSDAYLDDYIERNWDSIRHSVGGYKLEEEGVRLFSRIDGDYFNVLGLPLLELLSFLTLRGTLPR